MVPMIVQEIILIIITLVEIKDFNALIDNKLLTNNKNKKYMKNLLKYKEMLTIQQ